MTGGFGFLDFFPTQTLLITKSFSQLVILFRSCLVDSNRNDNENDSGVSMFGLTVNLE